MAARTLPAASPHVADGQVVVGVDDAPGGLGLPRHGERRLPVTNEAPEANPGHALTRMAQGATI
jgi:hypothetical protein